VRLRREKVALSPVYFTALQTEALSSGPAAGFSLASAPPLKDDAPPSALAAGSVFGRRGDQSRFNPAAPLFAQPAAAAAMPSSEQQQQGQRWGYLRLTSFSQNAAEETKSAIEQLEVSPGGGELSRWAFSSCSACMLSGWTDKGAHVAAWKLDGIWDLDWAPFGCPCACA
jgi:hypothetical protein